MLTADINWKMFINTSLPDSGGLFLMKFFRNTYYLFIALLQHKQVIISIIYVVYIQFNESPTPTSPTILPEAPQNGFLNQHLMQVKMGMIVLLHIERCSLKLVFHLTMPLSVCYSVVCSSIPSACVLLHVGRTKQTSFAVVMDFRELRQIRFSRW